LSLPNNNYGRTTCEIEVYAQTPDVYAQTFDGTATAAGVEYRCQGALQLPQLPEEFSNRVRKLPQGKSLAWFALYPSYGVVPTTLMQFDKLTIEFSASTFPGDHGLIEPGPSKDITFENIPIRRR
jgi:hypothetical protein